MTAAVWEATAQFVHRRTGLAFPETRRRMLEDGVARVMRRRRITSPDALVKRLDAEPALLDELVAEITVGETYFFRHPEQFDVIRDRILPELLRHVRDRPLRIWSAGCATGEEPYTLAIIAHEMGISGRVRILATDLSRHALRAARRGWYRPWSLRATPAAVRDRYFEERDDTFTLAPALRQLVEFRYLNLAEDVYPALSTGVWGMDLVLCRNVLIYFDAESGAELARRLVESLSDPGWLVVGASDPPFADWARVTVEATDAGLVYRRAGAEPALPPRSPAPPPLVPTVAVLPELPLPLPPPEPVEPMSGPPDAHPAPQPAEPPPHAAEEAHARYAARAYEDVVAVCTRAVRAADGDPDLWALLVRSFANLGRMDEAARRLTEAAERHPTVPELAYLEALLLADRERHAVASRAARRALYLDRNFVMAYLTLGMSLSRLGDRDGARRAYRNAHGILTRLPADACVPASDGEPAGRLLLLAQSQMELLEDAV